MSPQDCQRYYNLESYLFDEVSPAFKRQSTLSTFDFFCIVIWKANRSKSKIARRLLALGHDTLDGAVKALIKQLSRASSQKSKLEVLIDGWGFRLPMASAILTVLYPDEFTVYDVRVCEQLKDFEDAQYKTKFDNVWERYRAYIENVRASCPELQSLREKDRYLWGKSFQQQLAQDIRDRFDRSVAEPELEA